MASRNAERSEAVTRGTGNVFGVTVNNGGTHDPLALTVGTQNFLAQDYVLGNGGTLVVDDQSKSVSRAGVPVQLTATEYRLLLVLLRNKGKVMSRPELLEAAWSINFNMGTNVVDVYINYLRKKIDSDHEKKLIHTVVSMGYVLRES